MGGTVDHAELRRRLIRTLKTYTGLEKRPFIASYTAENGPFKTFKSAAAVARALDLYWALENGYLWAGSQPAYTTADYDGLAEQRREPPDSRSSIVCGPPSPGPPHPGQHSNSSRGTTRGPVGSCAFSGWRSARPRPSASPSAWSPRPPARSTSTAPSASRAR